jgi:microcystin-dependent protein
MSNPFVGEIRMFAGNFAPAGWRLCDGAPLAISQYDVLFNLIGTTYGGDGQETFNLPNLQSRFPMHAGTHNGTTFIIGEAAGVESVTLTTNQIPVHTHPMVASTDPGTQASPAGGIPAALSPVSLYKPSAAAPTNTMNAQAVTVTGGSQPHDNMHPFLCVNFIISMFGIFPHT